MPEATTQMGESRAFGRVDKHQKNCFRSQGPRAPSRYPAMLAGSRGRFRHRNKF
jgi:hypothetical protein